MKWKPKLKLKLQSRKNKGACACCAQAHAIGPAIGDSVPRHRDRRVRRESLKRERVTFFMFSLGETYQAARSEFTWLVLPDIL
jgi:hypothetical protein